MKQAYSRGFFIRIFVPINESTFVFQILSPWLLSNQQRKKSFLSKKALIKIKLLTCFDIFKRK